MARRGEQLSFADVVVLGLSPALLVGLIYSLTAFILALVYRGFYPERLRFILFCFCVAAVLISRIAMTMGRPRALAYAAGLGFATLLALNRLVEVPAGNSLGAVGTYLPYLLVVLIWWLADFLTQDCTHTGTSDEAGLLDFGLRLPSAPPVARPAEVEDQTWAEKYQSEREAEQRRHRPGTWLVVFSLAALPLFAIGQLAVPASDDERRREIFWLLTIYVGCGLGLLLTTSFLGLRRYLWQRKLEMPAGLTAAWLGVGAGLILLLLVLATFLPRPAAEYSIPGLLGFAQSKRHDADRFSVFNFEGGQKRGQGDGKGQADPNAAQRGGANAQRDPNLKGGPQAEGKQGQGGRGNQGQPQGGGKGNNQGEQGQGKGGQSSGQQQSGEQRSQDPNNQRNQGKNEVQQGNQPGQRPDQRQPRGTAPDQQADQKNAQGQPRDQQQQGQPGEQQDASSQADSSSPPMQFEPPTPPSGWSELLRWLVLLAIFAALAYAIYRYHKELLAWWQSLWAENTGRQPTPGSVAQPKEEAEPEPPPPFASFVNPFEQPGRFRSNEEIVRYTFAALESWAYEQNLGREPEETPHEFMRRLAGRRPRLEEPGQKVVDLYALILYAKAKTPEQRMVDVRRLWQVLPEAGRTAEPATAKQ